MNKGLRKHGEKTRAQLEAAERFPLEPGVQWVFQVPALGGIYAIWRGKNPSAPIYVGASSNVRDRLHAMVFRGQHSGLWTIAGTEIQNPTLLSHPDCQGLNVSYLIIPVGRTEAEEYLIAYWSHALANKHKLKKRFMNRDDREDFRSLKESPNSV